MSSTQPADASLLDKTSPFALLVDAANSEAQNQNAKSENTISQSVNLTDGTEDGSGKDTKNAPSTATAQNEVSQQTLSTAEDAIRRAMMHTEAMHSQPTVALGGVPSLPLQQTEYLQHLRLEALAQKRHQETLAQLLLAQDTGGIPQDLQAMIQSRHLRQAAQVRQELLLANSYGIPGGFEQQITGLGSGMRDRLLLQQYLSHREREQKLAALGQSGGLSVGAPAMTSHPQSDTAVGSTPASTEHRTSTRSSPNDAAVEDNSKTTVLPCRARGMPMDHNVKVRKPI